MHHPIHSSIRALQLVCGAVLVSLSATLSHGSFPVGKPVSPYVTGQNYWYQPPDSIYPTIMDSGVTMVRIGGHQPDLTVPLTNDQILKQVINIQGIGAEPLIQVSRRTGIDAPAVAAATVAFINGVHGRGVKYWSIGNEPDLGSPYGAPMSEADLAINVGNYTRAISSAMRDVDPTIHITALDMAWYSSTKFNSLLGGDADITGKDAQGRYYVDGINYHRYPFASVITRASALNEMHAGFEATVVPLLNRIAYANALHGRVGAEGLDWGLTEFNMSYSNPPTTINNPAGLGVSSFLNGQLFAEYYRVGMKHGVHSMNTWSMLEGGGAGAGGDLGYLGGSWAAPIKRSSYYHMQMVADYLIPGGYLPGISSAPNLAVLSTSSASQEMLSVMLLNEEDTGTQAFTLRLNNDPVLGAGTKVNVEADLAIEYSGVLDNQCTVVLVFDTAGALKQRITYSLAHYSQNLPPAVETFTSASMAPAAPTSLGASSGNAKALLLWSPADQAQSYSVKRALVSGGPYTTVITGLITSSFTDTGLTNGTTYYYVVTATNAIGESVNSYEVVALPHAVLPEVAISLEAEALSRTAVGATTSVVGDSATSGGFWVQLNAGGSTPLGSYMEFTTPSIPAGVYTLKMRYKSNNNRGKHDFSVDGAVVGAVDQYTPSTNNSYPTATIAPVDFATDGIHLFRMILTGKNAAAGNYLLASDKFSLVSQEGVATAVVTLSNLNQVYDGTPKSATAATTPSGLATAITYDGSSTAPTAPGAYTVIATVTAPGYAGISSSTLVISDTAAPVFSSLTADKTSLWPAQHQLVPVTLTASVSDNIGVQSVQIISATSNEPDNGLGDGDTANDIQITGAMTLNLRAERAGGGDGRIYTITVEARDAAGNATQQTVVVTVPKDQRTQ